MTTRLIDLSHLIEAGMATHPGLPGPVWEPFRSRAESREITGTDFQIDRVSMVGNTDGVGPTSLAEALRDAAGAITGAAVLLYTVSWLVEQRPALVGIDAANIDDLADPDWPAHTVLLGAGVLVLEHLTGLAAPAARGARLHAAPPPGVESAPGRSARTPVSLTLDISSRRPAHEHHRPTAPCRKRRALQPCRPADADC